MRGCIAATEALAHQGCWRIDGSWSDALALVVPYSLAHKDVSPEHYFNYHEIMTGKETAIHQR